MTVRTFELDVAITDNAGIIDVMTAIERAVKRASPTHILAAELRLPGAARAVRHEDGRRRDGKEAK